jgi:DNA-binding GntR family transcriptional regulator
MLAAAGLAALAGPGRLDALRAAIVDALAAHRAPDGRYRLENEFHYLVARA